MVVITNKSSKLRLSVLNAESIVVGGKEIKMSAPSKANTDKLDNPARLKTNHQAGTKSSV